MSQESAIKDRIAADLQTLVVSGQLGAVVSQDQSKDLLQADYSAFPVAIIGMPSFESNYETNRENLRIFDWPILFLFRQEEITSPNDIENLAEAISNLFDNDPTMGGAAIGAVLAARGPTEPVSTPDKSFIFFVIDLKVRTLIELTYNP